MLEVADLGREALQRAAEDGHRGQQGGMTVALHDLAADRIDLQVEGSQDLSLHVRTKVAVRSDRTRDLPGRDLVYRGCQSSPAAFELECPAGELEPERRGLSVDRVGPAHHHRVGLGSRAGDRGRQQVIDIGQQPLAGGPQLERQGRVNDVAAGQAEVKEAPFRPDRFGDLADEGDHVVVGRPFDLGDPLDVDVGPRLDRRERLARDQAARGFGPGDGELDPEHRFEVRGFGPDRAHLGQGVTANHGAARVTGRPRP